MPSWFFVAERDHDLQNPTSVEKIRLLGERLRLGPTSSVLDIASGKGGPALVLASAFGCRIVAVEREPAFVAAARERLEAAGLAGLVEIHEADAVDFPLADERFDVALCLGASFVWGGLRETLAQLIPAVHPRGYVAVGEPYWRMWPRPASLEANGLASFEANGFVPLAETIERLSSAGLEPVSIIASSEDDWDTYESLHWHAVDEWLAENPDAPEAEEFRRINDERREQYLRVGRELLGWAIFVGRKPG